MQKNPIAELRNQEFRAVRNHLRPAYQFRFRKIFQVDERWSLDKTLVLKKHPSIDSMKHARKHAMTRTGQLLSVVNSNGSFCLRVAWGLPDWLLDRKNFLCLPKPHFFQKSGSLKEKKGSKKHKQATKTREHKTQEPINRAGKKADNISESKVKPTNEQTLPPFFWISGYFDCLCHVFFLSVPVLSKSWWCSDLLFFF